MNNGLTRRAGYTLFSGLQVRAAGDEPSRAIEGSAIMFGVESVPLWSDDDEEAREVISSSAITRELLDGCDIKMTLNHDDRLLLARSNKGKGTLSYDVDDYGVKFSFEAPRTVDGDKALELVKRGDIAGCSFAFTTRYFDEDWVSRSSRLEEGRVITTYTVNKVDGVFDFTLTPNPAYEQTSVEARELERLLADDAAARIRAEQEHRARVRAQVREMREMAKR